MDLQICLLASGFCTIELKFSAYMLWTIQSNVHEEVIHNYLVIVL
jgi:hypothetical protein